MLGITERFDPTNPAVESMVRGIMQRPDDAAKYGVTLAEAFALKQAIDRLKQQKAQPPQTTVVQDMANEAQQLMESRDQGVAGLAVGGFVPQNYAGGGIVAFRSGGATPRSLFGDPEPYAMSYIPSSYDAPADMSYDAQIRRLRKNYEQRRAEAQAGIPTAPQAIQQQRALQEAAGIKGLLGEAREAELKKQIEQAPQDRDAAIGDALTRFGLGMAYQASQPGARFLGSISRAAPEAFSSYVKDRKELKALEEVRKKELATIETARRAEDLGVVRDASGIIERARTNAEKAQERIDTLERDISRTQGERETRREEIGARAEEGRLSREHAIRLADRQAAAQRTLEELRQSGNVDARMLADYDAAMKKPEAEREAALKQWEEKYTKIQRSRSRASGLTGAATGLAQAVRMYKAEADAIDKDYTITDQAEKERRKKALREEYGVTAEDIRAYTARMTPGAATPAAAAPAAAAPAAAAPAAAAAPSAASRMTAKPKAGDTKVIEAGPHAGKTAIHDGTGWKVKE